MENLAMLVMLLLSSAIAVFLARRYFAAGASTNERVQAEVVDHHSILVGGLSQGSPGNLDLFNYSAVYTFAYNGQDYRVSDPMVRDRPSPAIGKKVTLIFPPGQPEKAEPARRWFYALFAVLCAGAAVAILFSLLTQ